MKTILSSLSLATAIIALPCIATAAAYTYDNNTSDGNFDTLGNWVTGGQHNLSSFTDNNTFVLNDNLDYSGTLELGLYTPRIPGPPVVNATWVGGGLTLGADATFTLKTGASLGVNTLISGSNSKLVIESGATFYTGNNSTAIGTIDVYGTLKSADNMTPRFDGNNATLNFYAGSIISQGGNNQITGAGNTTINVWTDKGSYRLTTFGNGAAASGDKILNIYKGGYWDSITTTLQLLSATGNTIVNVGGSGRASTANSGNFVLKKSATATGDLLINFTEADATFNFGIDYTVATTNYADEYGHIIKTLADFSGDKTAFTAYQKEFMDMLVEDWITDYKYIKSDVNGYDLVFENLRVITTNASTGITKFEYKYSLEAIPEPAEVAALLGLIAFGFAAYRRRK